jgi:hypothetical protein
MAGVQTQVSQQQALVGPHLAAPYQSYIQYSPAAVPQNYGYGPTPVYPTNIPSAYGKGGASLGSNYPGSSYQDMSALTDVNKVSNAYGTTGLRGFGNEGCEFGFSKILIFRESRQSLFSFIFYGFFWSFFQLKMFFASRNQMEALSFH